MIRRDENEEHVRKHQIPVITLGRALDELEGSEAVLYWIFLSSKAVTEILPGESNSIQLVRCRCNRETNRLVVTFVK